MSEAKDATRDRLIEACIRVIVTARTPHSVTVREVARVSGTGVAALDHYYCSLDDLIIASGTRLYAQVNHERMYALQQAVERARPDPAPLRDLLTALIGPRVRWSLDPARPYGVFRYIIGMSAGGAQTDCLRPLTDQVEQQRAFIAALQRAAPWFDEIKIGWRLNAALGVRSQVLREQRRTMLLTRGQPDLSDPDTDIDLMLDVIQPMFSRPELQRASTPTRHPVRPGPAR